MINARSLPDEAWNHANRALRQYFSRRHINDMDELVQDTIGALWLSDYKFNDRSEFLKICYAFAQNILHARRRRDVRDPDQLPEYEISSPQTDHRATSQAEMAVLLREVLEIGSSKMREEDWKLLQTMAASDRPDRAKIATELNLGDANNLGVRLYRGRKTLSILTGWLRK